MCHIKLCLLSCSTSSISMIHQDWSHHSHEMIKFVYLFWKSLEIRINTNEWQLNSVEYGLQIWLTLKQGVFWNLTYSRSETNNALKISLEVMKLVYLHTTYVLSVLIIGRNITCTKFWILWICPRPTFYLYPISTQNMTSAKWWNTGIAYERLGTFIRPDRHEEKASQGKIRILHAATWASS